MKIPLKIKNETGYPTSKLRSLFVRVASEICRIKGREPEFPHIVRVAEASGYQRYIGYRSARLRVPKDGLDTRLLASMWAASVYRWIDEETPRVTAEWWKDGATRRWADVCDKLGPIGRVPKKPKKVKTPNPVKEMSAELAGIKQREKVWRSKLKRAQNAVVKVERERRKLERRLAKHAGTDQFADRFQKAATDDHAATG